MKKGFTLIELMVAVAIFTVVATMALGALLAMAQANKKSQTISSTLNNLNAALEGMARNIRTGYDYHCGTATAFDCPAGGSYFKFTGPTGSSIVYQFYNSSSPDYCGQAAYTIKGCIVRITNGGTPLAITPPEVIIADPSSGTGKLKFFLRGSPPRTAAPGGSSDYLQPNVVITMSGYIALPNNQTSSFYLQTAVTQRLYDQ
jgi:prepilin-type N-terminal cleavage/methylation domain-containing protein